MNFMSFGGLSQDKVLRSMKLFAEEVMPQLADDKSPAAV